MRISDWSSDVCSSDLITARRKAGPRVEPGVTGNYQAISARGLRQAQAERVWGFPARSDNARVAPETRLSGYPGLSDHSPRRKRILKAGRRSGGKYTHMARNSEERSGGKECVSPCEYRWSPSP